MSLKKTEISYIKPGLAVGGASMADIDFFKLFTRMGKKIDINVGFVDKRMQMSLIDQGFEVTVNPLFDRNFQQGGRSVSRTFEGLKQIMGASKLTIISQSYLGDAPIFNEALSEILDREINNVQWLRAHDFVRDSDMYEQATKDGGLLSLPTTKAMEIYMKKLSPSATIETLPYFISKDNFRRQSSDAPPKEVRERVGISQNDFVIFQPSRVDPRKRVGKAVYLASQVQKAMPDRRVVLLIAGGAEPVAEHKKERVRLEDYARKLDYKGTLFLNGLTGDRKYRRVSDYMQIGVADVVTFMSEIDAFGLPPLECSVAGLPCVTAPFKDEKGYPAFEYNYPGFSFVVDDQGDNSVSDMTVAEVFRIAKGSGNVMDKLEENARLAEELYGEQSTRDRLNSLLRRYGI